jgi:hypothetical protein
MELLQKKGLEARRRPSAVGAAAGGKPSEALTTPAHPLPEGEEGEKLRKRMLFLFPLSPKGREG